MPWAMDYDIRYDRVFQVEITDTEAAAFRAVESGLLVSDRPIYLVEVASRDPAERQATWDKGKRS